MRGRRAVEPGRGGPGVDGLVVAGAGCLAGMVAAQVASGVVSDPVPLTGPVVGLLAAGTACFVASRRGFGRAAGAVGAAAAVGYAAESVGMRTGVPFGRYAYTPVLRPQLGGVPVAVLGAWAGMGLASHAVAAAIVPAGRRAARVAVGAAALTAWDLFLDPQMVRQGLWTWADGGMYRGVPVSNFAGWLGVSALLMAVVEPIVEWGPDPSGWLVGAYGVMAGMETLAFAAVFDPPDRLVAVTGGAAMGVFAVPAAVLAIRRRQAASPRPARRRARRRASRWPAWRR
ncbi:carotenoid biosynthesis protein [Actinomadura syzygii]|uniref:Carotenoid biosynthesis protein n=1 Tax=Actinomadura syzygii TaxID=1427538 RepID=A0A5D0U2L5_9ACTN|nr:carotenoid biosynthesis protein [Actinomadura syzygii]TYC11269.1 carotenoid biosynthesis protein [Actinomadura syzygii]